MLLSAFMLFNLIVHQLVAGEEYDCQTVQNTGASCNNDRSGYFTCKLVSYDQPEVQTNVKCLTGERCSCHRNINCNIETACSSYTAPPKFVNTGLLFWRGTRYYDWDWDYVNLKPWGVAVRTKSGFFFKQETNWRVNKWTFIFIIPNKDGNGFTKYTGDSKSKRCKKTQVYETESLVNYDLSKTVLVSREFSKRKYEYKYDNEPSSYEWSLTARYNATDDVIIPTHYYKSDLETVGQGGEITKTNLYYTYIKKIDNAKVAKKYSLNRFCISFY